MSTSSRTNLAVVIYEQTFTNCVFLLQKEHEEATTTKTRDIRCCDQTRRTGVVFKFGVKYDGGHQRQSQSGFCTAAGETKRKRSHVLTLVIDAMQTMAWKDLS